MIDYKRLETELAKKLNLGKLRSGPQVIRNEKGWRENEILIEYIWIVTFERSFTGKGGILNIKYNPNTFREKSNLEKLSKAVFSIENNNEIGTFFKENEIDDFTSLIPYFKELDLFEANRGITLDGIVYQIRLISMNIETTIEVNNPNHKSWERIQSKVWEMGLDLSNKSKNETLKRLFE